MKKIFLLSTALFLSMLTFAQEGAQDIEMADEMIASGKIYIVVAVLVIVFIGIVAYLIGIDKKVSKLEKEVNK